MRNNVYRHVAILIAAISCAGVEAASYPARPIRMIAPFPAGGPTDALARVIAQKLTEAWPQQVVVDNRAGANGIIGQDLAAKAPPDGYTLLMQSVAFVINPSLYKLPYDSAKDFIPVIPVASTTLVLAVYPGVAARSVQELVTLAKGKPGALSYASFGNGSIAHLAGEMFKNAGHIDLVHVPYKGVPQAITDLLAGRVQAMFPGISSALPHRESGRLRILAVTSRKRSQLAADLPTMTESGFAGFDVGSWFGAFVPAGTPRDTVTRLHSDIQRALLQPDTVRQFNAQGFEVAGGSSEAFAAFIRRETEKFSVVIKAAGVKVD